MISASLKAAHDTAGTCDFVLITFLIANAHWSGVHIDEKCTLIRNAIIDEKCSLIGNYYCYTMGLEM